MKAYWHNLILSDQRGYKLQRHFLFWTTRLLSSLILHTTRKTLFSPWSMDWAALPESLTMEDTISIGVKLTLEALYAYACIYWLLPKYLIKGKYVMFALGLIFLSLIFHLVFLFSIRLYASHFDGYESVSLNIFYYFFRSGAFPVALLLIAYKMLKKWYLIEEEKTALMVSNTNAELNLLKAQVNPHFLFNTLNNIYSFTLSKSPLAGELVAKLSHIIRYMARECDQALVPLAKEIKILNDYMGLEKVRYGPRLDLEVEITGDDKNKLITPLLMIPFVENSFKHGASKILEHPWIKLKLHIGEEELFFHLTNSKPMPLLSSNEKGGLGLENVKRRLQLLYPSSHRLEIKSEVDVFSVEMVIALAKNRVPVEFINSELEIPIVG